MKKMIKIYRYCLKCGSLCIEHESGHVKCPQCQKVLFEGEYETSDILRKPQRPNIFLLTNQLKGDE